jgi:hypothetical protein
MPGRDERHEETRRRALADLEKLNNPGGIAEPGDEGSKFGPNDPMEKWGKLVGRTLGFLFLIYLIYWLSTKIV